MRVCWVFVDNSNTTFKTGFSLPFQGLGCGVQPLFQLHVFSYFHMFSIFDSKYVSEPPSWTITHTGPWSCPKVVIVWPSDISVLSPDCCEQVTVPRSCFTHVVTRKHRLKASSLQIGVSSQTAECLRTKT